MQLAILLALALILFLPLLMAWRAWPLNTELRGMRKLLATSAVLIISLAFLVFTVFSIATVRKHGWFNDLSGFTIWLRIGFWTSVAGLFLSSFGKGSYRAWGIAASGLLGLLWLAIAWAPA
jgi:hypothetical protein